MKKTLLALLVTAGAVQANAMSYEFDVTLKGYDGDATSSVAYSGQIARHVPA